MLTFTQRHFILLSMMLLITSCGRKSAVQEASGDVPVQIGVQTSATEYSLQKVYLKGITNLKEVSGTFAKFFYSPGSDNSQLIGSAPHADFIRTGSFFSPADLISMQMATIYYHMQKLAALDVAVGAAGVNQWPRTIGLETQIYDNNQLRRNNAFYNGQTDSMMFVPFDGNDLQIAMNAGIIAHEHFHSLFYKVVLRPAIENKKILTNAASIHSETINEKATLNLNSRAVRVQKIQPSEITEKEKAQLFNETYLRGINEGLADYWGWVYTSDPEFMRWSLPTFQAERTLNLSEQNVGDYETANSIKYMVDVMVRSTNDPRGALANYAYSVGTPYARFLKQFTSMQVQNKKIELNEAKAQMAQLVFQYITSLGVQFNSLAETKTLPTDGLFTFVTDKFQTGTKDFKMDAQDCEFLLKYINKETAADQKSKTCETKDNKTAMVESK